MAHVVVTLKGDIEFFGPDESREQAIARMRELASSTKFAEFIAVGEDTMVRAVDMVGIHVDEDDE
jgi:hypothetical protein